MTVLVKLSASLRRRVAGYDPLAGLNVPAAEPETVAELMARIGVPAGEVKVIMVNGRAAQPDAPVRDGDRVGLFPPVGGG